MEEPKPSSVRIEPRVDENGCEDAPLGSRIRTCASRDIAARGELDIAVQRKTLTPVIVEPGLYPDV